jgi:hypothetical protein
VGAPSSRTSTASHPGCTPSIRYGRENIEYKEEDPPVNQFYTDEEVLISSRAIKVVEAVHEHEKLLRARRDGWKAFLYHNILMPTYNLLPSSVLLKYAYKISVTAIKI